MEGKNIFIHIPKTGGTTINSAMNGTYWQTELSFNYRHIDNSNKLSTSKDIFLAENFQKYSEYKLFMMLREPVDRLISEYFFLRERKEYASLLNKPALNFEDYYVNPQTFNYMVGFLRGKRIYTSKPPTEEDLEMVIRAIDEIPIHVGIFEHFSESMGYFQEITGVQWNKKIEAKRMTFNRPKASELDEQAVETILKNNHLDKQLYDYCLAKFEPQRKKFENYSVKFELSKYNHIFPYMAKTCLFEFCLDNKHYIKQNFHFFKSLTMHLINDKKMRDGKLLVQTWNETVLKAIDQSFPNSEFYQCAEQSLQKSKEPLQQLIDLAQGIDEFLNDKSKKSREFYTPMEFNLSLVANIKPEKHSLFSKLFKS